VWGGLRHETLNEPEQDAVLGEVVAWIDGQLATLT
jgi:alpha-beta hydrolase superfamily lysophospholipase